LTSTPSAKSAVAAAMTSCVSSVLALSTTTMRNGAVSMAAALASSSLRKVDRLYVTIAMAMLPAAEVTGSPYRARLVPRRSSRSSLAAAGLRPGTCLSAPTR
jgi:hypothetical protein